jgi:hypothetical protein
MEVSNMKNASEYKTKNIKLKYLAEYARFSIKGHNFGSELIFPSTTPRLQCVCFYSFSRWESCETIHLSCQDSEIKLTSEQNYNPNI